MIIMRIIEPGTRIIGLALTLITLLAGGAWAGAVIGTPEPASIALLGAGVGGIAVIRFGHRK
jgi:PEP-CTERM motif